LHRFPVLREMPAQAGHLRPCLRVHNIGNDGTHLDACLRGPISVSRFHRRVARASSAEPRRPDHQAATRGDYPGPTEGPLPRHIAPR